MDAIVDQLILGRFLVDSWQILADSWQILADLGRFRNLRPGVLIKNNEQIINAGSKIGEHGAEICPKSRKLMYWALRAGFDEHGRPKSLVLELTLRLFLWSVAPLG